MGMFVRQSMGPSDKYGSFVYYVDDNGFVRKSTGPNDKYGAIIYYAGDDGFIRRASGPSDRYGAIVYYAGQDGFVRRSTGPSDRYGAIVYYAGQDGFVRRSTGPNDKYGAIVYYIEASKEDKKETPKTNMNEAQGAVFIIAFVIGLLFAPVLIVLGMYGKFLLGGLFKNVLPIEAFKKFRKTYSIINIVWLVLGIAAVVVFGILQSEAVTIALYALAGGNILLFILSIVIGNKIYNEHKDELPQTTEDAEDEIDTSSVEGPIFEGSLNADMPANNEDLRYDSYSVPPTQAEPVGVDTTQFDAMTRELESYKAMLDGGLISKGEYNNLKDILFRKYGISKESAPKKGVSSASLRKANIGVLITAIVCWVVGLFFMFEVRGYSYSYQAWAAMRADYSLLEVFDKDVLSCLSVIFIFVFGIALAADLILNLICSKKWALISASVITILFGAAAISLTSCLDCSQYNFFGHDTLGFLVTLISLLGVCTACMIVSLILVSITKPEATLSNS